VPRLFIAAAIIAVIAYLLPSLDFSGPPPPPASPPVVVVNTPPPGDGGALVLLTVVLVVAFLLLCAVGALGALALRERGRRLAIEGRLPRGEWGGTLATPHVRVEHGAHPALLSDR